MVEQTCRGALGILRHFAECCGGLRHVAVSWHRVGVECVPLDAAPGVPPLEQHPDTDPHDSDDDDQRQKTKPRKEQQAQPEHRHLGD